MNNNSFWYESVHDLKINENEVENFFYPIRPGETISFRESLAINFVNYFKILKKENNSYYD